MSEVAAADVKVMLERPASAWLYESVVQAGSMPNNAPEVRHNAREHRPHALTSGMNSPAMTALIKHTDWLLS